ncbi:hypothetical protein IQ06DRAFT_293818 [Phaeosphaeriaceae sp. SRC1lsM3a]|nr:hypothetical protein IQ06DRAFT_293818 [Stagonospora sp. SRC1lsM3a]
MELDENDRERAGRRCWECQRRRVVCDRMLPTCRKCLEAGRQCPGYDERKPLQWIADGRVTSRGAKKEITPKLLATSGSTKAGSRHGYDHTIQQLSISVLTAVEGRRKPRRRRATRPVSSSTIGSPWQEPPYPATLLPQYWLSAEIVPNDYFYGNSVYPQVMTTAWSARMQLGEGSLGDQQDNEPTSTATSSITTYPQMTSTGSSEFAEFYQVQEHFEATAQTSVSGIDLWDFHGQFLFL